MYKRQALQDQLNTEASKEKAEQLIKNNGMLPSAYESLIGIEVDDWEYTCLLYTSRCV